MPLSKERKFAIGIVMILCSCGLMIIGLERLAVVAFTVGFYFLLFALT